ncbi:MAG: LpxI family protein [Alphaproteobacteria bacterium]|nr:LpxI family protein [Alphaproteobacteria bacterium]
MSERLPDPPAGEGALAIICGGGSLPYALADAAIRRGRRVILFALRGWADPARVAAYPHHWSWMGQFGRFIRIATREGCRDVVFIGSVGRPSILQLRPDIRVLGLLPRILRLFRGGDDRLLSGVGRIFEEHGFRLMGPKDVAPELLMPLGPVGAREPGARDQADIAYGLSLLRATSPFDIGQAAIVADNHVLALEGPEGTDATMARVAELRRSGRIRAPGGVLIKALKLGQDQRIDLPSIGPQTIASAAAAGLSGVAVVAGTTIVAEPERIAAEADRCGIFLVGVPADETAP